MPLPETGPVSAGAYRDAYMSLSAAAVFAPYVRLELLQWDPIFTGQAGAAQVSPGSFLALQRIYSPALTTKSEVSGACIHARVLNVRVWAPCLQSALRLLFAECYSQQC